MSRTSKPNRLPRLELECLEDRTTPVFLPRPGPQLIEINGVNVPAGGLSLAAGNLTPEAHPQGFVQNEYVTGTGPGREGVVTIWGRTGNFIRDFVPFAGFTGGINVAVGDVLGDGDPEIIAAIATKGPPHVKVFTAAGQQIGSFYAFNPAFLGGVNIAVGNVQGGIAAGGFSGGAVSSQFKQEIIIGAAAGDAPHVVATDGNGNVVRSFFAFDEAYRGGVTVAAGSTDIDRVAGFIPGRGMEDTNAYDEIIVGAATNIPHVKVFEVWQGPITERLSFFAFDPRSERGVTVAAGSTDLIVGAEIYASLIGTSAVRVHDGFTGDALAEQEIFPPTYTAVVNMVVANFAPRQLDPTNLQGFYVPFDDDTFFQRFGTDFNISYYMQDLVAVAGDGPFEQVPRFLLGRPSRPAITNGPN